MYKVPFYPGDGETIMLEVAYIAEFPCDERGLCAFCHGDACDEEEKEGSLIHDFYVRHMEQWGTYAEHCPCCEGRPA